MKKVLLLVVCSLLIGSVVYASPLMDYSAGKGSVDLTWRNTESTDIEHSYSNPPPVFVLDKKYNFDGTLTFGLGNKFAIQYRNFEPKLPDYQFSETLHLKTNEFNLLYKLDKNVAMVVGFNNVSGTFSQTGLPDWGLNTRSIFQLGVVASTSIANKTTLWGSVKAGKNLEDYEVGVGYEFRPGWEFNVNYRYLHLKNLSDDTFNDYGMEWKVKGSGLGITYKF